MGGACDTLDETDGLLKQDRADPLLGDEPALLDGRGNIFTSSRPLGFEVKVMTPMLVCAVGIPPGPSALVIGTGCPIG